MSQLKLIGRNSPLFNDDIIQINDNLSDIVKG